MTAAARPRVVLTDPIHPDAHALLASGAEVVVLPDGLSGDRSHAALREHIAGAQGLIVRRLLPDDLFEHANALLGVVRHGVGLDFIPVDRASARRIPVANTPAVNANAVAEYAIAAMLDGSRRLAWFDSQVREGNWQARRDAPLQTFELRGRSLGIVGFGAIGRRLAEIAVNGFGMKVAAHTGTPSRLPPDIAPMSLPDLFAASDFVVVACPLTPQTRGMIDGEVLRHARPGGVLINVGRGPVVRESDLVAALDSGTIGGAVLDVFEVQPLPADSGLRRHPRVTLTPHLAGMTQDAERAMGMMAAATMLALARGERPANIVNPDIFSDPGALA